MPSPLMKTDVTTCSITTVRGSGVNAWQFQLLTVDGVANFGSIYDNANTFVDGSTSTSKALRIDVVEDNETIAIQDMDSIVIDGLTVWLPALTVEDTLYVDEDGNTWYDSALTSPAGGVSAVSDSITVADVLLDVSQFLSDSLSISDSLIENFGEYPEESIVISDSIVEDVEDYIIYLEDFISIKDSLTSEETSLYGDFSEDTQVDNTFTEI